MFSYNDRHGHDLADANLKNKDLNQMVGLGEYIVLANSISNETY